MSLYLLLDIGSLSFPHIFSFHNRLKYYREWKFLFPARTVTALVFIVWDIVFTAHGI